MSLRGAFSFDRRKMLAILGVSQRLVNPNPVTKLVRRKIEKYPTRSNGLHVYRLANEEQSQLAFVSLFAI